MFEIDKFSYLYRRWLCKSPPITICREYAFLLNTAQNTYLLLAIKKYP